jgi:hypothetical protein
MEDGMSENTKKPADVVIDILVVGVEEHHPDCPAHPDNARSGPARVATKAYRDGWDIAFGKVTVGKA